MSVRRIRKSDRRHRRRRRVPLAFSLFILRSLDRGTSNFAVGKQQSNEYTILVEIELKSVQKDRFPPSIKSFAEFADFRRSGLSIR